MNGLVLVTFLVGTPSVLVEDDLAYQEAETDDVDEISPDFYWQLPTEGALLW